ncbi:protein FAR1-RELATED SEQUENCE 5-like [Aegilops tauschii subsp. strangulata]|uniref:protein FAR1-RELATED SEQUENCE 5-like n=1 Tax=Aegilops tauschii subsp. strangulata TaxID=200361 RepID=UPI001E1CA994|nr:protein FAR1-RELATED SEQUENCE 5-like [Aegilops tauschii subsp. strangulata]
MADQTSLGEGLVGELQLQQDGGEFIRKHHQGVCQQQKKEKEMIDLNELPHDLNELPHDMDQQQPSVPPGGNVDYGTENVRSVDSTQPTRGPNPMGRDNVAGQSSTRGAPVVVSLQSESHTLDDTGTVADVAGPTRTGLGAGVVDGVVQGEEGEDEAGSQPMEPYVGMRFDSLQVAKDHYNNYALRMGFSVKMNTSRRTPHTNVLVKQQFCCNKYKKPKANDGGAEAAPVLDPIPDPIAVDGDEEMEDEPPIFAKEEAGPSKKKKKRKRETIKQTQCKAKMLVKLIDGRWEVIHFVRDHNHPLVNKPSLTKYLRSHQGISPDEKDFLRILYNCNLTIGVFLYPLQY